MNRRMLPAVCVPTLLLAAVSPVWAHVGHEHSDNAFIAGLTHPMLGLDHLLAMVAVGLLATRSTRREALWMLPAAFVGMMIVGGLIALTGAPMPGAEAGISVSVIALGLAVALLPRLSASLLPAAATIIGLFALAHGYAHVAEMRGSSAPLYLTGMALGTAVLHAAGLALGLGLTRAVGMPGVRVAGGAIAASFVVVMLIGV